MKKSSNISRRDFLGRFAALSTLGGVTLASTTSMAAAKTSANFKISLAEWSLHRSILREKTLDHLDFAAKARSFGIGAVEYVNRMFFDKANDKKYLRQMAMRARDADVKSLLIMVDGEGNLGDTDPAKRRQAVENHYKWVDAAEFLKCHSIRVNAAGQGTREEVGDAASDGLAALADYASQASLNVIVENHGGYSSDGAWLANVLKNVDRENCGSLPDFGNFCITRGTDADGKPNCAEEYDRYKGVAELMPFAKAVSAKSYDFDASGKETLIDYHRMLKIVTAAGYDGYVGIEYEGGRLSEEEGIRHTLRLLEQIQKDLNAGS
jgi:sugar phosphate isomerase/epimerase